jgi:hypothetical protein
MKNIIKIGLLIVSVLVLEGCASRWTAKTCTETNFEDLGYQEGSKGINSRINSYNQSCLKKKVQIPIRKYKNGYQKGLAVFCSPEKGRSDGSGGLNIHNNCGSIKAYITAHKKGLRSFCSTEKGVQDGFSMKPEVILCTSFTAYNVGYKKGKKEYCTSDRGYEHGFAGQNQDSRCVVYTAYKTGFSKGQKYFCSPENGTKLGKKGSVFPRKCETAGRTFRRNYNKGRAEFLTSAVREKESELTFERQNYERVRDDLQDAQFALGRLPKYSTDPNVAEDRNRIESSIQNLRSRRDAQRNIVEELTGQIQDMRDEVRDLKRL